MNTSIDPVPAALAATRRQALGLLGAGAFAVMAPRLASGHDDHDEKVLTEAMVLRDPDISAKLANQGVDANPSTPQAFSELIRSELRKYATVVKQTGAKAE